MGDVILEKNQVLSKSLLWDLQNATYTNFGPEAWSGFGVPFYITSNPYISRAYAYVLLGYLRDCLSPNAKTPIDLSQPVYIFDVGAGAARFGFYCLRALLDFAKAVLPPELKIRYVLCDMVEKNIEFWEKHPFLIPYAEQGVLDFAQYSEAEPPEKIRLRRSGEELASETVRNPIGLICNYLFDTIPQDLFRIHEGSLQEGLVTLSVPAEKGETVNPLDPAIIPKLKLSYDYRPIPDIHQYYPDDPVFGKLLELYLQKFKDFAFLFPTRPFKTIQYFEKLSNRRMLMLAGDQGVSSEEQVQNWGDPVICRHGSFSMSVSYHAIANYFRLAGGVGLLTSMPHTVFTVTASLFGGKDEDYRETLFAFKEHIDNFEPRDGWKLVRIAKDEKERLNLEQILLFLKFGYWDPVNFNIFYPRIRELLPQATDEQRRDLYVTIHKSLEEFYPVSIGEGIFIMNLGVLLYDMNHYKEALTVYQRSLEITGDYPTTFENIGVCYRMLGDEKKAEEYLSKAKEVALKGA